MFESKVPVSCYKEIAELNKEHGIYIVQHIETGRVYLKKQMSVYNRSVYEQLYFSPVKNVPRLYAMYEENNILTVIEEYISGDTLQEVIDICGPLQDKDVRAYTMMLCDILTDLHQMPHPVVHRDIKPSNIILTEDDRIVLIDLNAARLQISEKPRDTRLIGTEGFASPEQFGFGESTPLSDIYAVGNLMTVLLTGDTDPEKITDSRLKPVIKKCLELNPKDRYPSTAKLKAALERIKKCN